MYTLYTQISDLIEILFYSFFKKESSTKIESNSLFAVFERSEQRLKI
ncbi:hypothetical protein LEP1GSC172_0320 [Leptospira noguchii]|uniref:Uncharacterized protein n=1 Tax=Leptospira noguchii TaxID=28182 RepID=M6VBK1_9LEPT|nr:hypothetical protein LEP1GSC172_0320 [Leptospira noguchii]